MKSWTRVFIGVNFNFWSNGQDITNPPGNPSQMSLVMQTSQLQISTILIQEPLVALTFHADTSVPFSASQNQNSL